MSDLFKIGDPVLYMKVGKHANEDLRDIVARKKREIADAGFAMWGYGGGTCHPTTTVQPFARSRTAQGDRIVLCMQPMTSKHFAEPIRATEFSVDGMSWSEIPRKINVLGSRYALCIRDLKQVEASLSLEGTAVAVGKSKGRRGNNYIGGHVDKACLEIVSLSESASDTPIGLVAELVEPFAVFVRN